MVITYNAPKKILLKDFIFDKYIVRFELGDEDCWINAIVTDIEIPVRFVEHYRKNIGIFKEGDYSICLKTTFKLLEDVKILGYERAKENSSYSTQLIKVRSLREIENYPIEVIGEFILSE